MGYGRTSGRSGSGRSRRRRNNNRRGKKWNINQIVAELVQTVAGVTNGFYTW